MGVRFFCNRCGREMFQNITEIMKATTTVLMMDKLCVCSDCLVKELRRIIRREIEALKL